MNKIRCPNCGKIYVPDLPWPSRDDKRLLQDIYPDSEAYQREQLITGLCSDKCWDDYVPLEVKQSFVSGSEK